MSTADAYRRILSTLLPAGALGVSLLLGATAAQAAREAPPGPSPDLAAPAPIGERLAAIRDAVSDIAGRPPAAPVARVERLAWANWSNFGIGLPLPVWPVWNDWHNGWRNWNNNWHNGWHNWQNGWNNWGNGWHNY